MLTKEIACPNFEDNFVQVCTNQTPPCHNIEITFIFILQRENYILIYIDIFLNSRSSCQSIVGGICSSIDSFFSLCRVLPLDTFQWRPRGATIRRIDGRQRRSCSCKLDRFSIIPFIPSGEQGTTTRLEIKDENCLNGWQSELLIYTDASYAHSFNSRSTTRRDSVAKLEGLFAVKKQSSNRMLLVHSQEFVSSFVRAKMSQTFCRKKGYEILWFVFLNSNSNWKKKTSILPLLPCSSTF